MKKVVRHLLIASILFFFSGNIIAQTACNWQQGEMLTYSQSDWGDASSNGGSLLLSQFVNMYGSSLTVGGTATITFTRAAGIFNYLPATGPASILTGNYVDPVLTPSNQLGGEVLALQLNVDFSDSDLLTSYAPVGDLVFNNFDAVP